MSNSARFSRLFKSGSANPVAVGAACGAVVGLLTAAPVLLATAIGGVAGMVVASKKR